ncbi:MAG TPA: hypothetical protein VMY59_09925 [Candidatus Thermoplasmatota archaeon]|nr:hypothetical protein [Candidatus Thermoplasmatota archaeon]
MFNEVFRDVANRFQTWLMTHNVGTLVENARKDYLNRALMWLELQKQWECQVTDTSLTVSGGIASLPSNFLSMISIGHSHQNDGKIDWFYYNNSLRPQGYRLIPTGSRLTGYSYNIKFFNGYPFTPNILRYQKKFELFEDNGVEYIPLPGELLYEVAKLLRIEDIAHDGDKYAMSRRSVDLLLKRYEALQYKNTIMKREVLDNNGTPITIDSNTLCGGGSARGGFVENGTDG